MRRLVVCFLMALAIPGFATAFPLKVEKILPDASAASWKSSGQAIRSLWYSGSGELMIVAGSEVTRWKYVFPAAETKAGPIVGEFLQIVPAGEAFGVLTNASLEHWGLQTGKIGKLPSGTVTHDGFSRVSAAPLNQRMVFWSPTGKAVFVADLQAKPVAMKLEDVKPTGLALSPNGRMVAIASGTGSVQISNLKPDGTLDRKTSKRFPRREEIPLAFSPDGRLLAVASGGRLALLDVNTGQINRVFERRFDDGDITVIGFSPDGAMLAFGTREPSPVVRAWYVATGKPLGELSGHRTTVTALSFDTKLFQLASGDTTGQVFVWNLPRGIEPRTPMSPREAWERLDSMYSIVGHQAMSDLVGDNAETQAKNIPAIMTRLSELDKERERLKKAIADLDHDEFRIREAARRLVLMTSYRGMELLQDPARKKLGAEGEERVRAILARFEQEGLSKPENDMYGDNLRLLRVMQALETTAPKEAKTACEYLKKKFPGTRIALDAEAILGVP